MREIATLQPAEARLLRWLGLAVLLHAVLLLVPFNGPGHSGSPVQALSISLLAPTRAEPDRAIRDPVPAAPAELPEQHATAPPAPLTRDTTEPPTETTELPDGAPAQALAAPPPQWSAARLIELARQRESSLPRSSSTRKLGVFVPQQPPDNWRPDNALGESRFDGRNLPSEMAIVDRWLAADGTHNVLVETPAGDLLCGRAESWDPMRPLVEPVMMFRSCGPGTRTFEWPAHYRNPTVWPPEPAGGR